MQLNKNNHDFLLFLKVNVRTTIYDRPRQLYPTELNGSQRRIWGGGYRFKIVGYISLVILVVSPCYSNEMSAQTFAQFLAFIFLQTLDTESSAIFHLTVHNLTSVLNNENEEVTFINLIIWLFLQ